jgi:hypothetical protein
MAQTSKVMNDWPLKPVIQIRRHQPVEESPVKGSSTPATWVIVSRLQNMAPSDHAPFQNRLRSRESLTASMFGINSGESRFQEQPQEEQDKAARKSAIPRRTGDSPSNADTFGGLRLEQQRQGKAV